MISQIKSIRQLAQLKASEVMMTPVTTVRIWNSIHDVAALFLEKNISSAVVVDMDEKPLGVITKTDITRYGRQSPNVMINEKSERGKTRSTAETIDGQGFHLEPEESTLESWMTPMVFDVNPSTPLPTIVKKMVRNGVHHIFVTDPNSKEVKGVVTAFDLLMIMNRILNPTKIAA